jgi:hypothetical protein
MLHFIQRQGPSAAEPLDVIDLFVETNDAAQLKATDGAGNEYFRSEKQGTISFRVGGALGLHRLCLLDAKGNVLSELSFAVTAQTRISDEQGRFADLLQILYRTMCCYSPTGFEGVTWKGETYRYFVNWILDHVHTARGMQYFSDAAQGLVDLLSLIQREDGMIWSQIQVDVGWPDFFNTRDENRNFYTRRDGEIRMMRQPVENHCEYNFVDCVHLVWKSGGDDPWMKAHLDAACRALDYTVNSPVRWSAKFGLLRRGYTIDSWDFQIEDEYSIPFPLGAEMRIDEEKTKFGIFFGDNTGYAKACDQIAEMLEHAARFDDAKKYRLRGEQIRQRLTELSWNGRFFQHRVEEDPSVKRNLGVDEKAQIAMSNAYSLNRNISTAQSVAILTAYQDLMHHLPAGAPGEWYAIYPPFERGFGGKDGKWQYMNGGVHGHAAGELARGAFAHGRERYGADILERLRKLGKAHGDRLHFAYTGAYQESPPPQNFFPVDLASAANMDLRNDVPSEAARWMLESPDNDLRNLPVGNQTFAGVPYRITDPQTNARKAVIAVSTSEILPAAIDLPLGRRAAALYLLHTAIAKSAGIGGSITLVYEDGAQHTEYLVQEKHFCGWWFPDFTAQDAGVAWRGPNPVSSSVGLSWACLANPHPEKMIRSLTFAAATNGGIYVAAAVTLADQLPYHRPDPISHGGPDNWSGGTTMAALVEGLAGIQDQPDTTAFQKVTLSPRWVAADVGRVQVTVRYAASEGYVSYIFAHLPETKTIELILTGNATAGELRLLLPEQARGISEVQMDGENVPAAVAKVEASLYATLRLKSLQIPRTLRIVYSDSPA